MTLHKVWVKTNKCELQQREWVVITHSYIIAQDSQTTGNTSRVTRYFNLHNILKVGHSFITPKYIRYGDSLQYTGSEVMLTQSLIVVTHPIGTRKLSHL